MGARLLNANLRAAAKAEGLEPHRGVGFWCEPGVYSKKGPVPASFEADYPTDVYQAREQPPSSALSSNRLIASLRDASPGTVTWDSH